MLSPCRHHGPVRRGDSHVTFLNVTTPAAAIRRPGLDYASSVGQVILSQTNYMTVTAAPIF